MPVPSSILLPTRRTGSYVSKNSRSQIRTLSRTFLPTFQFARDSTEMCGNRSSPNLLPRHVRDMRYQGTDS